MDYAYDGGSYFGKSYFRYEFAYDEAAEFPTSYADTINLLTAFVPPTDWRGYWAVQTTSVNYYQTMVDYFMYDDTKKTPSGLNEEEAAERLDTYVPFLYDEHMKSPSITVSTQATDNTWTVYRYCMSIEYSLSGGDGAAYRDAYIALLEELGYRHLDRTADADETIWSSSYASNSSTLEQYKSSDGEMVLQIETDGGTSFSIKVYDLTKDPFQ